MSSNYEHEHHDHHEHDHHDHHHHERDHHDHHHERDHHDHHERDHHGRDHHGRDHHERPLDRSIIDDIKNHLQHINNIKNHDLKDHDHVISSDTKVNLDELKASDGNKLTSLVFDSTEGVTFKMDHGTGSDQFKGTVVTGGGDDTINLSGLGVQVSSGDGNDTITTGAGNDSINAGSGDDSVTTGAGNDTVETGTGNDTVNTGSGSDIVKLVSGYLGSSTIDGGSEKDTLDLSSDTILTVSQGNNDTLLITLDNNSVLNVANVESFIYDDNGTATGGNVEIVGVAELLSHFQQIV